MRHPLRSAIEVSPTTSPTIQPAKAPEGDLGRIA
jgi:hypothetical protein